MTEPCPTCGALPCDQVNPEAAAALRQSPSVEEVAGLIREHVEIGEISECSIEITGHDDAAQAIAALYGGKRDG